MATDKKLSLSTLKPAAARKSRKRIGRGLGSGKGRYSGRGIKGQKARSGTKKMRPGFEGGQMPIYMRLGKQRGQYSKDAGLIRNTRLDVKILGHGDLTKKLKVSAHLFSASAREKIEKAGGSITWLRGEPKPRPPKRREKPLPPKNEPEAESEAPEEPAAEVEEPPTD